MLSSEFATSVRSEPKDGVDKVSDSAQQRVERPSEPAARRFRRFHRTHDVDVEPPVMVLKEKHKPAFANPCQ